jgi:alkylhydroperoxidase family enzyme
MARIPLLQADDPSTPPDAKLFLQEAGQARGRLHNIFRAMANRPEAGRAFLALAGTVYFSGSSLDPMHGEFAYLTSTVVNNCFY